MSEKEPVAKEAGTEEVKEEKQESSKDANASGAGAEKGEGEKGGEESGFKPMTEAEQTAWKEATRKDMVSSITKDVKAKLQSEAETEAAKAAGDFEKLAKQRQERVEQLEREAAERDRKDLRARIAKANKLPDDLAALLQGEDEAALTESAKLLAKHIKPISAADTEAGVGAGVTSSDTSKPIKKVDDKKEATFTFEGKQKVPWGSKGAA